MAYFAQARPSQNLSISIKTVLVEDSKTIRDALIPTMDELGHMEVVAVAESADDAAKAMHKLHAVWELAVVDQFLKQGSGLDVLRACQHHPGRVVVVLSNYATRQMRDECTALGADAIFDKSTQLDAFFEFCATRFASRH